MRFFMVLEPKNIVTVIHNSERFVESKSIAAAVGGYFEVAENVTIGNSSYTMWWNEAPDGMDENDLAFQIYAGHNRAIYGGLQGNVVITNGPNDEGDTLPLSVLDVQNIVKSIFLKSADPTPMMDIESLFLYGSYLRGM